jgi:pilus assembly protein CpaB
MNSNESRTLWISVASALIAVFLLYSYTQEKSDELTKKFGAKQRVVTAKKDIAEMQTITDDMLQTVEQPVDFIQPKAIKNPEDAIGMVALAPIKKDEQLLENKVVEPGPVTGLSLQVAPTKRAVSIPVDEVRGIARLVKPGDRVDILAAVDVGRGPTARREVRTMMQDVTILATGLVVKNDLPRLFEKRGEEMMGRSLRQDTNFNTITIEATPKEAQDLIFIMATSPGSLFMTLRHPSDNTKSALASSTSGSVSGQVDIPILSEQMRVPASVAPVPVAPQIRAPVQQTQPPRRKGPFRDL